MKLLSIIVPMYNSEKWLPKCVESLIHQDIPAEEYEIILVDDGSPDGCRKLAKDYASRYGNILVLSRPNGGTSAARNTGIHAAQGKYLYFVDPDDYILENSLKDILCKMEDESLDVLRFAYVEVDENGKEVQSVKHPEPIDYSPGIMEGCRFMAERLGGACYVWTYLFRTAIIKENSIYCQEGVYYDDTTWLPQVLMHAKRVESIDVRRHFYLIRSGSLVQAITPSAIQKKIQGLKYIIEELQNQRETIRDKRAIKWYDRMISHCVLSLLSSVGKYKFAQRKEYIGFTMARNVYPLSYYRCIGRNRLKIMMVNLSPELFCKYIHFVNQ